ncbi:MAG: metal-sulfur cluster assembly factor [Candidatus Binataceae bacterium]
MSNRQAVAQVWRQLASVTDPELDEPLPDLGFIQSVEVESSNDVRVTFKLPTYWCAANFAFMMARDIRERIEELGWVQRATVELVDHFCGSEINRGVADSDSFKAAFPDEATGDLDDLRRVFQAKAFMHRQAYLLRYLLREFTAAQLVALTVSELAALQITDEAGLRMRRRYVAARQELAARIPSDLAFVRPSGQGLTAESLPDYLKELRGASANIDFNVAMCSSLLRARLQ